MIQPRPSAAQAWEDAAEIGVLKERHKFMPAFQASIVQIGLPRPALRLAWAVS